MVTKVFSTNTETVIKAKNQSLFSYRDLWTRLDYPFEAPLDVPSVEQLNEISVIG